MKKVGLFLLAVVMVVGLAGCPGGGDDFSPTVQNMAGVYNFTKISVTSGGTSGTIVPPDISGTINLTTLGTYTIDITIRGERTTGYGIFQISGDTIILDFGEASGPITDDGRKISFSAVVGSRSGTLEFTRA